MRSGRVCLPAHAACECMRQTGGWRSSQCQRRHGCRCTHMPLWRMHATPEAHVCCVHSRLCWRLSKTRALSSCLPVHRDLPGTPSPMLVLHARMCISSSRSPCASGSTDALCALGLWCLCRAAGVRRGWLQLLKDFVMGGSPIAAAPRHSRHLGCHPDARPVWGDGGSAAAAAPHLPQQERVLASSDSSHTMDSSVTGSSTSAAGGGAGGGASSARLGCSGWRGCSLDQPCARSLQLQHHPRWKPCTDAAIAAVEGE